MPIDRQKWQKTSVSRSSHPSRTGGIIIEHKSFVTSGKRHNNLQRTKSSTRVASYPRPISKRDIPKQPSPERNNQRDPRRTTVPESSSTLRRGGSRRCRRRRPRSRRRTRDARDARGLARVQRRGGRRRGPEAAVGRRRGRGCVRGGVGREGQDGPARVGGAHCRGEQRVRRQRVRGLCLGGGGGCRRGEEEGEDVTVAEGLHFGGFDWWRGVNLPCVWVCLFDLRCEILVQ